MEAEGIEERINGLKFGRWITQEQLTKIENLVHSSGGNAISRPQTGDEPYGPTIYELKDEPLIVYNKESKANRNYIGWVFPSEKHAKLLNDRGIVIYSELLGGKDA